VIASLARIHTDVQAGCDAAADALHRMAQYQPRLSAALAHVESGDRDRFAKPLAQSYRDIWLELDEDLSITLKLARTAPDA
jgi:hypothetical protein